MLAGVVVPLPAYRRSVEFGEPSRVDCGSCGAPLPPARSLAVRCAACQARWGPSRFWTVPAGAIAFGGLAWTVEPPLVLAAALILAALALALAAIDLAVMRLPDPLVLIGFCSTVLLLSVDALAAGGWSDLLRAAEGGAAAFSFYLVLALLPGASLGFGDVKVAGVMGLLLGYLGWGGVLLLVMVPWVINAPFAVGTLLRHGRGAVQPFGPALLAGSLIAIVITAALRR